MYVRMYLVFLYAMIFFLIDNVMLIFIKLLTDRVITLKVNSSTTIKCVKRMIEDKLGIPCDRQRLKYGTRQLYDGLGTLSDCGVKRNTAILLIPLFDAMQGQYNVIVVNLYLARYYRMFLSQAFRVVVFYDYMVNLIYVYILSG